MMALAIPSQALLANAACLAAGSGRLQGLISAAATSWMNTRACSSKAPQQGTAAPTLGAGRGNVYPALTPEQLAAMRVRRQLAINVAPAQLLAKQRHAHQKKHILICTGADGCAVCGSGSTSSACGGGAVAQRSLEYLQVRLAEINKLRAAADDNGHGHGHGHHSSDGDHDDPAILGSSMDCARAAALLPPLAAAVPHEGPIAVVLPEGVFYERVTPVVLERILEEHILGGHVVTSHVMLGTRAGLAECSGNTAALPSAAAAAASASVNVVPALDISRRATPSNSFAAHYAR